MRTPDDTLIFVTPESKSEIFRTRSTAWAACPCSLTNGRTDHEATITNGKKADPRSFCIQKTLQDMGHAGALEQNLMFAGHNAYRFGPRTRSIPTASSRPPSNWSSGS